ncbi:hypothetical protein MPER_11832 [Moniliophthora perniciosa FA553]|nr:hypothetical protein MPER_11832 [Moniliophthora perniciosa FA553]
MRKMHYYTLVPKIRHIIGALQKINTNDHIGGAAESIIMRSQTRVANIRRWLRRRDCPEAIRQLKVLFDKAFVPVNSVAASSEFIEFKGSHRSYLKDSVDDNVKYSPATTHAGNSNVIYRARPGSDPVAGQIQYIENVKAAGRDTAILHVRQYLPLPSNHYDPFQRYPHIHAKSYCSDLSYTIDKIAIDDIVSHAARFDYSEGRSVLLNLSRA